MALWVDQTSGSRDGDVIGRALIQVDGKELAQGEGIGESPSDAPLAIQPFEEPDHHHAKVLAGSQRWPSEFVVVETGALCFAERIEPGGFEHLVEARVERMAGSRGEFAAVPEVLLSLSLLAGAHRHKSILKPKHSRYQMFLHFRHRLLGNNIGAMLAMTTRGYAIPFPPSFPNSTRACDG